MRVFITVFAVKRLTQLITEDELTRPPREAVQRWANKYPDGSVPDRLAYLVDCQACASVWTSAIVLGMNQFRAGRVINAVLAGSAAALLIDAAIKNLEDS